MFAARSGGMVLDECHQIFNIRFTRYPLQFHPVRVVLLLKLLFFVQNVSSPAGHAGTEVSPRFAEDDDCSRCHIFAAVVPDPFNNSRGTTVSNTETFTGSTGGIKRATRGTV